MTMETVQQIQSLYRTLNSNERKAVKLFVTKFSGEAIEPATPSRNVRDDDWLLTGFISELHRRGFSYRKVDPQELAPNYGDDARFVREQLIKHLAPIFPNPSYTQLLSLGSQVAKCLADRLQKTGPVGLKRMLASVGKTLEAIDDSFPDYLSSGMLYFLIQDR